MKKTNWFERMIFGLGFATFLLIIATIGSFIGNYVSKQLF